MELDANHKANQSCHAAVWNCRRELDFDVVIVGDGDGVVVIPKDLADEIARDGVEQEGIEAFIKLQVEKGRSTIGLYPPDDTIRAEYADWLAAGKPR